VSLDRDQYGKRALVRFRRWPTTHEEYAASSRVHLPEEQVAAGAEQYRRWWGFDVLDSCRRPREDR
jgi:hypothetical protein